MFIKAQHIIPVEGPACSPGVLQIEESTIKNTGGLSLLKDNASSSEKVVDLGPMVIFPGFVNAHCHLDLTAVGPLATNDFVPWIKEVVCQKNRLSPEKIREGILRGIKNMIKSGVTTIGDHIGFTTDWETMADSSLRGILFAEVTGLLFEVSTDILGSFAHTREKLRKKKSLFDIRITPHSVHAVHPDTFARTVKENPAPLSCHLAESQAEYDYFKTGKGGLAQFIGERGFAIRHKAESAVDFINRNRLDLGKFLVIHGNYLSSADLELAAKNRLAIVHCPGSHKFFGHRAFPLGECITKKINIAVGTDSIASNTGLDFLSELKKLKTSFADLAPEEIIKMATINGARALRMETEIGSLVPGKKADLAGFKIRKEKDLLGIPLCSDKADFVMINGKIVAG